MTATDTLGRLRGADPVTPAALLMRVPSTERERVLAEVLASEPPVTSHQRPHAVHAAKRLSVAAVAVGTVAAVVIAAGVISRPDHIGGPTTATAADVLHAAAATARATSDYQLTGTQRVYSGYLESSVGQNAPNTPVVVSGEWWTDANGAYLLRTRAYSKEATKLFGIAIGASDYFHQSAHPNDGSGDPLTYRELRAIPTDPANLAAYVRTHVETRAQSTAGGADEVGTAIGLLVQPLAPARLRGALWDLLGNLPGVVNLGPGTDVLGRTGVLIGYADSNPVTPQRRSTLLLDPVTAAPLEQHSAAAVSAAGVKTFVRPTVVAAERVTPPGVNVAPE